MGCGTSVAAATETDENGTVKIIEDGDDETILVDTDGKEKEQ